MSAYFRVFSRVDESGAVTFCQVGFLRGETSNLDDAIKIADRTPGGYVKNSDNKILAPDGTWI